MSKLQLLLLGHFDCLLPSGQRISLTMRKAEVLLAYLALAPGIRHPRERLINLLWSDRGEEQARNSLRQCLSAIRKSLGDSAELLLLIDRTTVCLKPDMIETDALEFERLATSADFESLTNAAALYRGEFLEGIAIRDAACQEWLDNERARFKRQYIEILSNLGHTLLASRDYVHAIRNAERLVEQDPLAESGWRLLMRACHENGDRSHALQAFKRCQKVLRDELDVEPDAETVELRDAIASGDTKASASPAPAPAIARSSADTTSDGHVVAVLPFDNLSGDPEQEYFSDGISDSIILNLALFPGLQVKSRNSSFAFKEQIKSVGEISAELGVDYLVEGSVRRSAGRIRVNVQLIESASGNQVWSKRYDSDLGDLFELEENLSRSIAATVTGKIETELQRIAISKGIVDQDAHDLLLQGIYYAHRNEAADLPIAIDKLNESLALDPNNAQAHAALTYCYEMGWIDRWMEDFESARTLCGEHAHRALELAPNLGMAQIAYAEYMLFSRRYEEAESHLKKALEINPNDSEAIGTRAIVLSVQGRFEEALAQAQLALALDPYHRWARWIMSETLFFCGRYRDCLATIDEIGNPPGFIQVYRIAASIELGRIDEARNALRDFIRFSRENMAAPPRTLEQWRAYSRDNAPFADPAINDRLIDYLVKAGLEEQLESTDSGAATGARGTSIAVLPFDNLSGDPEQEYFSDGITDSIILNLALFPGLRVKSRNSSFAFKQQLKGLAEISRELDVDYIVEGSLRKSKDRVRITAQLIEAESGHQVWGKRYDAALDDLFDLEEELSRNIAATVTGQIDSDLQRIAVAKGAANQQAYDLLLCGIYHAYRFAPGDNVTAIEKLNQCIAQEPDNVRAHVYLSICHVMDYIGRWTADHRASFDQGRMHIEKALQLDPKLGLVHTFYAEYLGFCGKPDDAIGHLEKALKTNPNDTSALTIRSFCLALQGKFADALELAEQVVNMDPYHPWAEWELAAGQYWLERYEACLETLAGFRTDPDFMRIFAVASHVKLGQMDAARHALQEFLQICRVEMLSMPQSLDDWLAYIREVIPYDDARYNRELFDCLVQAGLEEYLDKPATKIENASHSIAVLPFDNLSGDPAQEYFSDGITESIILNLALFPGLHVKSRNSSFAFKQQLKGLAEISRELDVDYIVEGSLRKSKDRIRITAQLVEASSGNQVWGKRYDVELDNLFELEEELSRSIAATVTGRIKSELQRIALSKGAADQQAYDLLLAGVYYCQRFNRADMVTAIDKLNQCLKLDPDNARAHANLAFCHIMNWMERWVEDYQPSFELAREHAARALALDPDSTVTLLAQAEFLTFDRNYDKSEACIDKVLRINPNNAEAMAMKALILEFRGAYEAALEAAQLCYRLDPHHPWNQWNIAESQYLCGRYEDALKTIADTGNAPGFIRIYNVAANVKLGRIEQAREALRVFLQECRESMLAMPQNLDEWLRYSMDNAPFMDSAVNRDHIDCLVQAGLEDELAQQHAEGPEESLPGLLVLPFANLSGDPEQEYFSDGITDSVIVNLSAFPGLRVKSRHASFAYRDSANDIDDFAAGLGVQYIVEGNIRKSGNKVRITVQLSETGSGNQVWGKRFDYDLDDLFELEEELSMTLAGAVNARVGKQARLRALRKPAKDLQSYDYYMRGSYHLELFNAKDIGIAIELLDKCLALDANNSLAHAKLGIAHMVALYENCAPDRKRSFELMDRHLRRALELDPDDAEAHAFMAELLMYERDFDGALVHAQKAVELNPTLADGYSMLAWHAGSVGLLEEARAYAEKSMQTDIHHPYAGWNAGEIYRLCEEYERAIQTFRTMAHMSPSVHAQVAACLAGLDRIDEARAEMQRYLDLAREQMVSMPTTRDEWYRLWWETMPYKHKADNDRFFDLLVQAGLCDDKNEPGDPVPSIVVLPFTNLSGDPEQEYFSDGITTGVILSLSLFDGLVVKSQKTSFAFKNSDLSSVEIAEQVGADFLVEGSIRKSAQRIRLSVQLIEAESDSQIWGKQYDQELQDVLELEQELSKALAATISGRLGHRIQQSAARKPATDMKSYDHLMRGLYHFGKFTAEDMRIAREEIEKCIASDPANVQAHANLAEAWVLDLLENWAEDRELAERKAREHFEIALELDPDSALAHAYFADFLNVTRDYDNAQFHAERAIEINPNSSEGHASLADLLSGAGCHDEAIREADICLQLDPYSVGAIWVAGSVYRNAGRYQEAIKLLRRIPHPPPTINIIVTSCFIGMGLVEEGRAEMKRYLQVVKQQMPRPPDSESAWREHLRQTSSYFRREEDFERLLDQLLEAGLCDSAATEPREATSIAVLPFRNLSNDGDQEYFSDGITSSLILGLGMFRGLRVKSQNSSFAFRDSDKSSAEIAAELDVDFLIEGSMRKSASKIRLAVQLVEAESDTQIWGKQYDAELDDILELEQQLSSAIAGTISGRIGHTLQQSAIHKPAKNLRSYDYLLRGLYHFGKFTANDLATARDMIEKCLAIDPDNAIAHANLGTIHMVELMENWSGDRQRSEERARRHLQLALEHDPESALAHAYMSEYLMIIRKDYTQSEFHADRAIECNPTASEGYVAKADLLSVTRRVDEAVAYADKGLQLDPYSVGAGWAAGAVYREAGLYQKSIKSFRSISHPPASVHALIAACFMQMELFDEARQEMGVYRQLAKQEMASTPGSKDQWRGFWRENVPYQYDEDFEEFFELLVGAGLLDPANDATEEVPSIAVLPFENMSDDPEQAFFSDGITSDIISILSKFKHLRTVARHSTEVYRERKVSIAEIAAEQGVRYILEGSVRKSGKRIRVSAELIDSQGEHICWSERYDRDLDDLFAVQDEITRSITVAMRVHLDDGEKASRRSRGTDDIKAWELTLIAADLQDTYIQKNIIESRALLQQAIELDPDYCFAWIFLGWTHWQEAYSGWCESFEESMQAAQAAVDKALELEPDNGEAWSLAGTLQVMKHEPDKAIEASLEAIRLEPSNAEVYVLAGFAMNFAGEYDQARQHFEKSLQLGPLCPNWYYGVGAQPEIVTGNLDRAIELLRRGVEVSPDSPLLRFYLASALLDHGDEAGARRAAAEIRRLDKRMKGGGLVRAYSRDPAVREHFRKNLESLGLV